MDQPFPAYQGDEPYVFVCYAHEDEGVVYPEIGWLHEQGINLWYDEGISAGRIWREEIGDAIKGASSVLYYISESSLASDHCSREINFALDQHKNVLPVYLAEVALTTDLEVGLSRVQALHRGQDPSYKQHLLNALGQTAEATPPSPSQKPNFRWPRSILIGLMAAILIGMGWWYWQELPPSNDTGGADAASIRSIAVLPFANLGGDPEQEYFVAGMHDALIAELARLGELTVISRTSVMRYEDSDLSIPEIAKELDVGALVEGSVLKSGDRVRIQAQLIAPNPERHLWNETYDRDLHDVLTLHQEVTRDIARQIELSLSASESDRLGTIRPVDPEAYRLYLQGRYLMDTSLGEPIEKSIVLFKQATEIDPDFALAYVGLADAYTTLVGYANAPRRPILPLAQAAAEQALELDPSLGEAYAALGWLAWNMWDWPVAERYYSRAIELSPSYASARIRHGAFLALLGHFDEGLAEARTAQQLDPLSIETSVQTADILRVARRYDDAVAEFDQVLELHPGATRANFMRGLTYVALGRHDDALREFEKCISCPWAFGVAYAAMGRTEDALEVIGSYLERIKTESFLSGFIALQYAAIGDKDQAFEWLERAYENGDYWPETMLVEPLFDPLRDDPRFDDLVRRMNFPATD